MPIESFIIKHKNIFVRENSRSGGIFTALTDIILDEKGVVYGCQLDSDYVAYHGRSETIEGRDRFRGSKYIQSDLKDTFRQVKKDLVDGRTVLFSGTSCQIAGLKAYCAGVNTDNLYCIDIICHGVPSPMVWKDYLIYCEKKYGGKVTEVEFINKKRFGWKAHKESVWINGKEYDNVIFTHLFRDHNILRPACYECPYKSIEHPGDITIGDAWGIDKVNPEFNDNKGVSLVLINSDKGKCLLQKTYNDIDKIEINVCDYIQTPLIRPYEKPCTREKFWKQYKNKGFSYIVSNYVELSWHKKIIRKFLKYTTRKKYE